MQTDEVAEYLEEESLLTPTLSTPSLNKYPDIPFLNPAKMVPALNPIRIRDGAGLEKARVYLSRVNKYVFDYETNCVDRFFNRRARTIQFGDRNEQYLIDLMDFAQTSERLIRGQGHYRNPEVMSAEDLNILAPVIDLMRPSLDSNSHLKIGHFLQFEYTVSKWCLGIRSWNFWCTLRAERDITNGLIPVHQRDFWGLDDLVRRYCNLQIDKGAQKTFDLETPLEDWQEIYMALDVRLPDVIHAVQVQKVAKAGLKRSVQITMDAIPAFGDMHLNGMLADPTQWNEIIEDNKKQLVTSVVDLDSYFIPIVGRKIALDKAQVYSDQLEAVYRSYDEKSPAELELSAQIKSTKKQPERVVELKEMRDAHEELRKVAKEAAKQEWYTERVKVGAKARADYAKMDGEANINYGSSKQVLAALHASPFGLTSKNCPNTDGKRTLIKFPDLGIVQALRKFKAIEKQLATYSYRWIMTRDEKDPLTKKSGYVDPDTGRLHPDFRQCGADTGRPSCTDPNVLNLPRDPRYRKAFISRPGYDMVCKDCAGQELRILTEYSQEPAWIKAFLNKQDVHSISSEMINKELWKSATIHVETTLKSGKVIPPCAYYYDDRKKCDCPGHKTIRDVYKAFNFGMVYDKSDFTFAIELNKDKDDVAVMTSAWKAEFAITQRCLEKLRNDGYNKHEARDLAGGRRIMRSISYEQAKIASYEKFAEKTTADRIMKTMEGMIAAVKREAGNMPIQGTGARLMMLAMGCGFDPEGKPYLWHTLEPKHQALLLNYVYDEFVVESPEPNSVSVGEAIEDAIIRAGGEFVKCVPMESDGMISKRWQK